MGGPSPTHDQRKASGLPRGLYSFHRCKTSRIQHASCVRAVSTCSPHPVPLADIANRSPHSLEPDAALDPFSTSQSLRLQEPESAESPLEMGPWPPAERERSLRRLPDPAEAVLPPTVPTRPLLRCDAGVTSLRHNEDEVPQELHACANQLMVKLVSFYVASLKRAEPTADVKQGLKLYSGAHRMLSRTLDCRAAPPTSPAEGRCAVCWAAEP